MATSLASLAVIAAVVIGVISGMGLSARVSASNEATDVAIAEAYYEAVSPSGITDDWESVLEEDEEEDS